jgi:hypothetical protein
VIVVLLCWLYWQQHRAQLLQQEVTGHSGLARPHPMRCLQPPSSSSSSSVLVRTLSLLQTWGWQQHATSSSSSMLVGQVAGVLPVCWTAGQVLVVGGMALMSRPLRQQQLLLWRQLLQQQDCPGHGVVVVGGSSSCRARKA